MFLVELTYGDFGKNISPQMYLTRGIKGFSVGQGAENGQKWPEIPIQGIHFAHFHFIKLKMNTVSGSPILWTLLREYEH